MAGRAARDLARDLGTGNQSLPCALEREALTLLREILGCEHVKGSLHDFKVVGAGEIEAA